MENYSLTYSLKNTTRVNPINQDKIKNHLISTLEDNNFKNADINLHEPDPYYPQDEKTDTSLATTNSISNKVSISHPIIYQRKKIGEVKLSRKYRMEKHDKNTLLTICKRIALLVKRHQATQLSGRYLGKELSLIGYSENILKLDDFIEKAASSNSPVIVYGEHGCEKLSVACAIHYNSQIKHKPFVELNCSTPSTEEFQKNLIYCFKQAHGGSIFLNGIDELSSSQQNILVELLSTSTEPSQSGQLYKYMNNVRLLASANGDISDLVDKNLFSRQLFTEINFLTIRIPSLCERKEDIPCILDSFIEKHKTFQEQGLSNEVKLALCEYRWPENLAELERVIVRLTTLTNSNPIGLDDLQNHAPEILKNEVKKYGKRVNHEVDIGKQINLIDALVKQDYSQFNRMHSGLKKALKYIAENYYNEITLSDLSSNSFVSSSHLSYLFKSSTNKTFKQILAELRIEKAKHIFSTSPNSRITDISLQVGFGDLSHFEKIFKRHTKQTPREYRSNYKTFS